jgi:hypothetical protein
MSTRAVVTIKDSRNTFHIYTHSDGYPEYQVKRINDAMQFAWALPRFEAMDFSAAFVAGSKEQGGGGIYLTDSYENHGDLEYRYEITAAPSGKALFITVYAITEHEEPIWAGTLSQMIHKYGKQFVKKSA